MRAVAAHTPAAAAWGVSSAHTRASNYISISAAPPVEGCGAAGLRSRAQP